MHDDSEEEIFINKSLSPIGKSAIKFPPFPQLSKQHYLTAVKMMTMIQHRRATAPPPFLPLVIYQSIIASYYSLLHTQNNQPNSNSQILSEMLQTPRCSLKKILHSLPLVNTHHVSSSTHHSCMITEHSETSVQSITTREQQSQKGVRSFYKLISVYFHITHFSELREIQKASAMPRPYPMLDENLATN